MDPFIFEVKELEGRKVINFANNTSDFLEIVFTIDGRETKEGKIMDEKTRGYAYTPKLEKPVKKMKDKSPLRFSPRGGIVEAYIFDGHGSYKEKDLDKPTFLRYKLVDKIKFKRTSNKPVRVLKIAY